MKHTLLLTTALGLLTPMAVWTVLHPKSNTPPTTVQQAGDRIGNMALSEFNERNRRGGEAVAAINPNNRALNAADKLLMDKVVMGGKKQLMIAQAVQGRLADQEATLLAQSELEEQTGLDAKLKQLAAAKGYTPPAKADQEAMKAAEHFKKMDEGRKLDHHYVMMSGVQNHQKLLQTMTMVRAQASDPALKALANATLPVIRMHLNVSQAVHRRLMPMDKNHKGKGKGKMKAHHMD